MSRGFAPAGRSPRTGENSQPWEPKPAVEDLLRLEQVELRGRKPGRSASAARIRRYRRRKRLGQIMLKVTATECDLVEYLIATGRLSEAETFARNRLELFLLHALLFHGDEIEKRVAGDVDELMRREELFDFLAWPAADIGELVADSGVFGA